MWPKEGSDCKKKWRATKYLCCGLRAGTYTFCFTSWMSREAGFPQVSQSSWLHKLQMTGTSLELPGQPKKKTNNLQKSLSLSGAWNDIAQKLVLGRHFTVNLKCVQVRRDTPKFWDDILGHLSWKQVKPTGNNKYNGFRLFLTVPQSLQELCFKASLST